MRIGRLELDGVGPFEKAVFEIPPPADGSRGELVLFEGPNGCGKTTLALALALAAAPTLLHSASLKALRFDTPAWTGRHAGAIGGADVELEHDGAVVLEEIKAKGIHWSRHPVERISRSAYFDASNVSRPAAGFEPPILAPGWTAYAFQGRQTTPAVDTPGPAEIDAATHLAWNLSFGGGSLAPPLGQLLTNIDYERARSALYAQQAATEEEKSRFTEALRSCGERLQRIQDAFSTVLDRRVEIRFRLERLAPQILFDGEEIPLEYLGEGLRSTVAWLADLLVRLELTPWARRDVSAFDQDFWLILDEVEVNLHPRMQAHLFPALRRLFPNARIYATVHSPFAVAAAGEGIVFPIRPDPKTHRVTGTQRSIQLEHGQSLSWVVEEVFSTPSMFLDEETRSALDAHDRDVKALLARKEIAWEPFLERRRWLMGLNEEVSTIVAMREIAVQRLIDERLEQRDP